MAKKHINYDNWSKDELVKELKRIKETTYGLVWHRDVPEEKIDVLINPDARTPEEMFANEVAGKPFPVLKEVKGKEVVSNKDDQTHILIEGDNYHSLAVLNFTHQEAIDVIYIDPPYNTGENDFIYNDNFVDKDDPYKHSKWLSFMEKRLKLALPLLKTDGVIFISIDNNEFAQLKLLCDEVFDEKNFLGCLTWIKRTKSTNSGKAKKMIQQKTEYIFVYGRQSAMNFGGFNLLYSEATKKYPHKGKLGKCRFENLEATDYGRKKRDTMKFPILGVKPREGRRWQIGADTARELVEQNKIELVDGVPMRAVYPDDEESESFIPFWSHLEETGSAESGKKELSDIVGPNHGFDTVKPTPLMKQIFERFDDDITILDFFAGSGTTGHAILDMNANSGNRKFILCTNNDGDISTKICHPRLRKVMKGYKNNKGEKVEGLGGNLKYFTAYDFVESEPSDKNKHKLVNKCTEMLCIKEGIYDSVTENDDYKILKSHDNRYLGIIFYEDAIDEYKKAIKKIDAPINTYVFSLGDDPHTAQFADVADKVVLQAIPEIILKVYQEIFR